MSTPANMKVVAIREPGGPDVLVVEERPVPQPKDNEILVRVRAAGVNRPDVIQRSGGYPPPKGAPEWPGLEISGTVVASGPGASRYDEGDEVVALLPGGGYAEYAVVHETNALPAPAGLSPVEAAGVCETYFTVWHNVFQRGGLKSGESFMVHGGTSGIGTTAIQLAKIFGARVIATAGSADKCESCRELGADLAINYREEDWVKAAKDFAGGGVDVILDMVGGDYIEKNYAAAAPEGRIVQIAFLKGSKVEVDFTRLMLKRLHHTGSTLRSRSVEDKAAIARELEERVWPLLSAGTARVIMDSTFPLAEAAAAHARLDADHIGKVVLTVAD